MTSLARHGEQPSWTTELNSIRIGRIESELNGPGDNCFRVRRAKGVSRGMDRSRSVFTAAVGIPTSTSHSPSQSAVACSARFSPFSACRRVPVYKFQIINSPCTGRGNTSRTCRRNKKHDRFPANISTRIRPSVADDYRARLFRPTARVRKRTECVMRINVIN